MLGIGEEELTRESNNTIPWLILTQLIVLFLLFAFLFFFTLLPLDPDHHHHHNNLVTADTPPPTTTTSSNVFFFDDIQIHQIDSPLTNHDSSPTHPTTTLQGGQNLLIRSEIATGPSPSMRREEEIIEEEEASSLYFHPCHYFQLATVAFLKCFGLDSTSDSPSTRRHRKRKES